MHDWFGLGELVRWGVCCVEFENGFFFELSCVWRGFEFGGREAGSI